MAGYKPIKIAGFQTGLVQEREDFLLVEDAFPVLENAYIWREKILKKRGKEYFGRLRRLLTSQALAVTGASPYTDADILTTLSLRATEADAEIQCSSVVIVFDSGGANETTLIDANSDGNLALQTVPPSADPMDFVAGTNSTINYVTGALSAEFSSISAGVSVDIDFNYYPSLPVMGLKTRELNAISSEDTIAFDTKYAYQHTSGTNWQELLAGTTWSGLDSDFFWTTNYWVDASNNKLFWVTNFTSGAAADPMRYYNGILWTDFDQRITEEVTPAPDTSIKLYTARMLIPFRGRMLALNTFEGTTVGGFANATQIPQRIRWSQIGTPIDTDSWKQDIRGKGSFLDIPTSEHIVSAGFVRDNLVIYCERSTWQLRYIGRDISPFQIERVNTELGAESTFSAIQFDKALVGIGDKRIVSCDSFDSQPIDIKIPDFAINIENENLGHQRVHGIRDIQKRLAFWTYPSVKQGKYQGTYPNSVLVYNYENDSWAIFKDSITTYGYVWLSDDPTWEELGDREWGETDINWTSQQEQEPIIVAGNQKGYVHKISTLTANQQSLPIKGITGNITTATLINCPNHNLDKGTIIEIKNIPTGTGFASSLNEGVFFVDFDDTAATDENNFLIKTYNADTNSWSNPQLDASATYVGCGEIYVRDNFRIITKKFHHMDEGSKIQIGYIDALMTKTDAGQVSIKMYVDYNQSTQTNVSIDPFFNAAVPTTANDLDVTDAINYWHRIFSPLRGNFVQAEFTLDNAQMNGQSAVSEVVLHALIVWEREAGRLTI
jgi:hypothetical protein